MKNIYLESDEEIISAVDKLVQSDGHSINLFIPSGAQIWQSSINLKLLKREVNNLKKNVTLVVSDDLGAEMARRIGFIVKKEEDFPIELVKEEEVVEEEVEVEEVEEVDNEVEEETNQGIKFSPEEFSEVDDSEDESELPIKEEEEEVIEEETVEEEEEEEIQEEAPEEKKDMIDFLVDELKPGEKKVSFLNPLNKKEKVQKVQKEQKEPVISLASSKEDSRQRMADIVNPSNNTQPNFFERKFLNKEPKKKVVKIKQKPKEDIFLNQEEPVQVQEPVASKPSKWPKFLIIFIIIAFLIAALVGFLALSSTKVIIHPRSEKIDFDLSVVGSKEISTVDVSLNKIPIQEIEVSKSKSKEFEATGEEQLNEKAKGFITIYNGYSSSPQVLVAVTRFESPDGKIFRIPEKITVPGAKIQEGEIIPSSIDVEVVADEPGEEYNIDATNFSVPGFEGTAKYEGFYARSKSPMTGGSTDKIKVVSSEDIEKAEGILAEEIKNEVKQAFDEQIPTELKIIESALTEDIITVSTVKEGAKTDKFTIEMKAVIKALLFKEDDIKNLIDLNLVSIVPDNKEPVSETQDIEFGEPIVKDNGEISFELSIEEDVAWKIDTVSLKNDLIGLNEVEVRKYLSSRLEIKESKVSFWPFWVKHIPSQKEKIKIIIDSDGF